MSTSEEVSKPFGGGGDRDGEGEDEDGSGGCGWLPRAEFESQQMSSSHATCSMPANDRWLTNVSNSAVDEA